MQPIHKVTAFITCQAHLALFQHPYAGIQVPAGTVNPGEAPKAAAFREASEETGLVGLVLLRSLGSQVEALPADRGVVLERTPVYARPDPSSFDWAILPRGATVRLEREMTRDGQRFSHVTYAEMDALDDPRYVTYQITGWVPSERLTDTRLRHFFLFAYQGELAEPWEVETDNHRYRVFWAPLEALPEIVAPQRAWLKMLGV